MITTEIEREPRIIPFDIDYLRARAMFQRQKNELVIVHGSKAYRFQPSLPRDAARMSYFKILLERLKELPEEERMTLRLGTASINPTHYAITKGTRGVDLQFHLRPGTSDSPGTYRAMTKLLDEQGSTPVCDLRNVTRENFHRELRQAIRQSYEHFGLESHLR